MPEDTSLPDSPIPLVDRSCARFQPYGLGEYSRVLELQEDLRSRRQADRVPDTWLVGEHPMVITQGVRGKRDDLIGGVLPHGDIPVVEIDRGGMTTLHSPGQLVIYPICRLKGGSLAAGRMAHALIEGMKVWLRDTHGVNSEFLKGRPGLFVEGRKLMSVGISVRQGVSMHGIAMNLSNDLSLWDRIVACGEPGTRPASLSEILGRPIHPQEQLDSLKRWLTTWWGYQELEVSSIEGGGTPETATEQGPSRKTREASEAK